MPETYAPVPGDLFYAVTWNGGRFGPMRCTKSDQWRVWTSEEDWYSVNGYIFEKADESSAPQRDSTSTPTLDLREYITEQYTTSPRRFGSWQQEALAAAAGRLAEVRTGLGSLANNLEAAGESELADKCRELADSYEVLVMQVAARAQQRGV
jgi:hypothetical protein